MSQEAASNSKTAASMANVCEDRYRNAVTRNRVWCCLECGKCSAVCPITRWEHRTYTSPRLLVEKQIEGRTDEVLDDPLFWSCLTCKRCSELCPSEVHFSEFLRDARAQARECGRAGECTHSDAVHTWARIMANPEMRQSRLRWLDPGLKVSASSDTVYFTGCLPYFDPMFRTLHAEGLEIARAAVKILNHLGIEPQVLADERCCGHDQLWEGELETFRALGSLNLERLRAAGAKRIITTCPECARTLKLDYPAYIGPHDFEVLHISELVAAAGLSRGEANAPEHVTYHDPCRLGRHLGVYDPPRQVLDTLGVKRAEMDHARSSSLCCGSSCWTSCGQASKSIQVERLREARATGAELLVTACVKCQIHFRCAQADPASGASIDIPIRDWTTFVAERL